MIAYGLLIVVYERLSKSMQNVCYATSGDLVPLSGFVNDPPAGYTDVDARMVTAVSQYVLMCMYILFVFNISSFYKRDVAAMRKIRLAQYCSPLPYFLSVGYLVYARYQIET